MSEKVSSVLQKLDQKEMSDAFLRNTLMDFLNEAQEQKRRELEEKQRLNGTSTHNPVLPRGLYQSSLIIRQTISYI
jgi:hypothetical protein